MKRKIFIGSFTEGYAIAEQIRDEINTELEIGLNARHGKKVKFFLTIKVH